jgi:PAS domain S-box-containing protein
LSHDLRAHQIELEIQNEELRGLQQELEASKSRYKELYDYAPAGHITVSEQGLIVEGNRTAARLLNVAAETLVGQTFFRFILAEDQDIYYQHRAAIFETAEPQSCKLRLLRPDLPPFWVRLVTAPVGGETVTVYGWRKRKTSSKPSAGISRRLKASAGWLGPSPIASTTCWV